jgi:hypothetical protein
VRAGSGEPVSVSPVNGCFLIRKVYPVRPVTPTGVSVVEKKSSGLASVPTDDGASSANATLAPRASIAVKTRHFRLFISFFSLIALQIRFSRLSLPLSNQQRVLRVGVKPRTVG